MKRKKIVVISVVAIVTIILISIIMCKLLGVFNGPEKEFEWWKDFDNLECTLTDERSDEQSYSYMRGKNSNKPNKIEFNYQNNVSDNNEYIPTMTLKHKGEEKSIVAKVDRRIVYPWDFINGCVDYSSDINIVHVIKKEGFYRVHVLYYLTQEDADNDVNDRNFIFGEDIYINLRS